MRSKGDDECVGMVRTYVEGREDVGLGGGWGSKGGVVDTAKQ